MLYIISPLQKLGVPPDLASYNILLKTCCNAREFNLAQEIYEEIKKKEHGGALKLDVFTYSTMIKVRGACCYCSIVVFVVIMFMCQCVMPFNASIIFFSL
jgi:pentatricopeptide repeat protein